MLKVMGAVVSLTDVQTQVGGQRFLGLPASDIVLTDQSAVAVLNTTAGTVSWDNFTEPAAAFEHHFISHPASG